MRAAISHRMDSAFQSTLPTRGSDPFLSPSPFWVFIFQSTLPTRGSDVLPLLSKIESRISIHAPHEGERQIFCRPYPARSGFQSTLPTRGSDRGAGIHSASQADFNPRSPRGGATFTIFIIHTRREFISIHAPHEGERPPYSLHTKRLPCDFNPRSPQGGATVVPCSVRVSVEDFNPRSPQGGATIMYVCTMIKSSISIHAPRKGERR